MPTGELVWAGLLRRLGVLVGGLMMAILVEGQHAIRVLSAGPGSSVARRPRDLRIRTRARARARLVVRIGLGDCVELSQVLLERTGASSSMVAAAALPVALDGGLEMYALARLLAAIAFNVGGLGSAH